MLQEATRLHDLNINVFAVGVGGLVDVSELLSIASIPLNVFTISNFDALSDLDITLHRPCPGTFCLSMDSQHLYHLRGLGVKASALRAEDSGFESRLRRDFSRSSHTSDLKIGTPVTTLPGAWRCTVSTGIGRPGVSIL